jgi:class 3 adenylate cyclase
LRWLDFLRRPAEEERLPLALELLVVEGVDVGHQFTLEGLDGDRIRIGRGQSQAAQAGAIRLSDPELAPEHAVIHLLPEGPVLEPLRPTRVNDREIERAALRPGDRIRIGSTVLELRAREGPTLTLRLEPTAEVTTAALDCEPLPRGELVILRGVPGQEGRRVPLRPQRTTIGRRRGKDLEIPNVAELRQVSRDHAEIAWSGDELVLVHTGQNTTFVDGVPVEKQVVLRGGERIQLANRVLLALELEKGGAASPRADAEDDLQHAASQLAKFRHFGSFLDVDIVDSTGMKVHDHAAERIIVSFQRFRDFVGELVREFRGEVLNCNGDELMCFFEAPLDAVRAASSLLDRLEEFNARQNLLARPFRVRQGIHTGDCLLDRRRGLAFSNVLDLAGHLQKHAEINGVLVSAETLSRIPEGLPFEDAGILERDGIRVHRLAGRIA